MLNDRKVPILKGPDKSLVLCHNDLDGCNALQICHKWLKETAGKDHDIEFRAMTYEYINGLAAEVFKEAEQYRYILIGDISIDENLLKIIPKNCFIFDHHDTSKFIETHPQCYWTEDYCGAVVAWKALYRSTKPTPKFGKLMSVCNQYDMWFGHPTKLGPPQLSWDMNALQRNYGYNRFFEEFYNGFTEFTPEQRSIIDEHWRIQDEAYANADKLEYGPDVTMLIMHDQRMDPNYWCNELISNGHKAVLVFYPSSKRLSLRINKCLKGKFHGGFFLRDNIKNTNNSKGGHALAAGCSVDGMSSDEILNVGIILNNELEKIS